MKLSTFLVRAFFLAIMVAILLFLGRHIFFPSVDHSSENDDQKNAVTQLDKERNVVPVETHLLEKSLQDVFDVSSSGGSLTLSFKTSSESKWAVDQLETRQSENGITITRDAGTTVVMLSEGSFCGGLSGTTSVPVPMLVSFIDNGVLQLPD